MEYIPAECSSRSLGPANQLVGLLIQSLLSSYCSISEPDMWPKNCADLGTDGVKYDYIVVGAGSAGSVVASRLTEDPNVRVLLIEAGGDPPIESEIPGFYADTQAGRVDWQYSAYAKNGCGSTNNICYWPRGKMLGGSSGMQFMMFARGNKFNFDYWASLGNKHWNYDRLLQYFKRWEGNTVPGIADFDHGYYHNQTGPEKISFIYRTPIGHMFLKAAKERNNPIICDINADKIQGYLYAQGFIYDGFRQSAAKAFLIPAKNRPNLCVIKNAQAYKILFDDNKAAIGVQYNYNGTQDYTAYANKEVIVSAGTIGSPQLLLLSGIGPKSQLDQFNIPVICDLQGVGENLHDVPAVLVFFKYNFPPPTPTQSIDDMYDYLLHKDGPLTGTPNFLEISGFWNSKSQNKRTNNDMQMVYFNFPQNATMLPDFLGLQNYTPNIITHLQEINQQYPIAACILMLVQPKSVGSIKLNSSSYLDDPIINANYFDSQKDVDAVVRSIKRQIGFLKTKTFGKIDAELIRLPLAPCDSLEYLSYDYWACYVYHISESAYHPVGTCKMGPKSDRKAVVDRKLRVHRVKNLRVIDASIMPYSVSAVTNSATLAIGEKGAAMIKKANSRI